MTLRILLVEDNELNRSLVRAILDRTKHPALLSVSLVESTDLAQARKALSADEFDVVLLDVHLPDGSGLSLAREITDMVERKPAIVALTAAALPREQAAAMDAGCDTFLAKPYTSGELVDTITRLLPG
jgi:two-component system, OmpR family, KDP operon response regulator KdpE